MKRAESVASCVAPGRQAVLFRVPADRAVTYVVIGSDGRERARSSSLGVAVTAARRVLMEQGEVWIRASDDTCVHVDTSRVATDTPLCRWIQTVAATLEGEPK